MSKKYFVNNKIRRKRKEKLVKMLGGCCSKCGYKKSITAISFHHINPKDKLFDLSKGTTILHSWEEVVAEARKCILLCLNCHAEEDNDKKEKLGE